MCGENVLQFVEQSFLQQCSCYDSLPCVCHIQKSHLIASLLNSFQPFLDKVVLWDMDIDKTKFNLFDVGETSPCPAQLNGCDCGLFTAVVLSYIVSGVYVKSVYFTLFLLVAFFARSNPRVHGVGGLVVRDEGGTNVTVLTHIE